MGHFSIRYIYSTIIIFYMSYFYFTWCKVCTAEIVTCSYSYSYRILLLQCVKIRVIMFLICSSWSKVVIITCNNYMYYCACLHNRKIGMQWKTYSYQGNMLIFSADTGGSKMVMLLSLIAQRSGHVKAMPTFLSPGKPKSWKHNIFNAGWLIGVMHIRQEVVNLFLPSLNDAL